jgi:hypothetical protein
MKQTELTDKLIKNLEDALKAKSLAREPFQLASDMGTAARSMGAIKGNFSIDESWISTVCYISIPGHLSRLVQLLNAGDNIIETNKSGLTPIENYYEQISKQRTKIEEQIKKLIENKNLVFTDGRKFTPLGNLLEQELEILDQEVMGVNKCYERLTKVS